MFLDINLYKLSQFHLKLICYHPLIKLPKYMIPIKLIVPVPAIILLILSIMNIFYNLDNILIIISSLDSVTTIAQVLPKLFFIGYYKKRFGKLMMDMEERFWSGEMFDNDFRQYLRKQQYYGELLVKIFFCIGIVTLEIYTITSLIYRKFPFDTYAPNYYYVQSIQMIFIHIEYCVLISFTSLLIVFCVNTYGQFLMIGEKVKDACKRNDMKQLRLTIEHHQFLLKFIEELRDLYSMLFLIEYGVIIISYCLQIYQLISLNVSNLTKLKAMSYILDVLAEFGVYCFPASNISDAVSHIKDVIVQSDWYDNDESFKKILMIMMMRSDKEFALNAGGIAIINRSTYVQVFKAGMSFATWFQTLHD